MIVVIKCAKCRKKILKYLKVGKGMIHRCYKPRILKYYITPTNSELKCECGNVIGIDEGRLFKMKKGTFTPPSV